MNCREILFASESSPSPPQAMGTFLSSVRQNEWHPDFEPIELLVRNHLQSGKAW